MAYNNFGDGAQPQQGAEEAAGFGAPGAQQMGQMGQQMDPNQQQGQFPGGQPGGPGAPGGQPGGDQKTTLWYVVSDRCMAIVSNGMAGWVNSSRGSMRTSLEAYGSAWVIRSMSR